MTNSEIPKVDSSDYEALRPDSYHTAITSQEELLEKYIRLLNPLVEKMVDADTVVFLDKSARPLYWMVKAMWPYLAPQKRDADGKIITEPMPQVRFANIDRLAWRRDNKVEIEEGGARIIEPEDVAGLRAIYKDSKGGQTLDEQKILLVDEQSETGDTLLVAKNLFGKAFPSARVEGFSWIRHPWKLEKGQRSSQVKEIPLWYPPKDPETGLHKDTGRGVLSPVPYNPNNPEHGSPERFPAESYQFLSTGPRVLKNEFTDEEQMQLALLRNRLDQESDREEKAKIRSEIDRIRTVRDPESLKLREEIGQMAIDFATGKLCPAILTDREEILGMSPIEYNRRARDIREKRNRAIN
jgi:hypothetical protein